MELFLRGRVSKDPKIEAYSAGYYLEKELLKEKTTRDQRNKLFSDSQRAIYVDRVLNVIQVDISNFNTMPQLETDPSGFDIFLLNRAKLATQLTTKAHYAI